MPNTRFPHNARGYLYYYLAPNAPALSRQIRFRVTGTNDPALFSSGEDLLRADHLPWRIPVVSLPRHKYYAALLRRLVDDGLVSEHLAQVASSSPCDVTSANVRSAPRIVHAFGQPFLLQFGQAAQPFYFIGAETVLRANFVPLNIVRDTAGIWGATIKGSALCRFEKSTLPEHAGRRVVACRVIRVVEPIKSTGFCATPESLIPREGELVCVRSARRRPDGVEQWTYDVDRLLFLRPGAYCRPFAAGLDLLYDNEARAGGPVGW